MNIFFYNNKVLLKDGKLRQCCCDVGLAVESVAFELLSGSDPCCNRIQAGDPVDGCRNYDLTLAGATLLAADHLAECDFRSSGERKGITTDCPDGCGFCENATFSYFLVGAEEVSGKFILSFEAEDCVQPPGAPLGIPPRDYLCTVTIRKCI